MKSLLVIGGSGFFGKSILDAFKRGLLSAWDVSHVIVIARHASALRVSHQELITPNVALIDLDISKAKEIPHADYVIHAATSTDARNYQQSPENEKLNILEGTYNYCRLAGKFHPKSKIVFTSSGAIYGQQPSNILQIDESYVASNFNEMSLEKIHYAQAKQEAENAIRKLAESNMNVSIARCFAFVGRYLPRDQHFAIGNFLNDVLDGNPIYVKAKRRVFRSYMYADDLVEWLMTIADYANPTCPIFNVGSDQEIGLIELAKKISDQYSVPFMASDITDANDDRYIPSIQKARQLLNLTLKYDLKQAIDKTISLI